ncbi:MAG: class I SAM-dependent methyltransferase [Parvularculaceae bacterium]|nr:class I SAM-dependent methyltransferase [Parvularculaceae bacterium]
MSRKRITDSLRNEWARALAMVRRSPYRLDPRVYLRLIDAEALHALQQRYERTGGKALKYLDVAYWMKVNARRLADIPVGRSPPCLRLLDIGCGAGYFLFIARALGHDAVGLDVPDTPFYEEMIALLDVPRVMHRVKAFEALPDELRGYDVVSAHMTCFNRLPDRSHWRGEEWAFFVDDAKSRLNPGGTIQLHLNKLEDGRAMTPEVEIFFRKNGFVIDRARAVFRDR